MSQAGFLAAFLALSAAVVSIGGAVLAAGTAGLRLKWLWAAGCLIGFGWLQVGWESGAVYHGIGINFPVFGASQIPGSLEWWVRASIPVIAILFIGLRATGVLKPKASTSKASTREPEA